MIFNYIYSPNTKEDFNKLKRFMYLIPILVISNFSKTLIIESDALRVGIDVVII